MAVTFTLNGRTTTLDADPEMPLLWAVRDEIGLTGTKFGCGLAQCGACTMHVDGQPVRSCSTPLSAVEGQQVTTIEGLGGKVAQDVSMNGSFEDAVSQLLAENSAATGISGRFDTA